MGTITLSLISKILIPLVRGACGSLEFCYEDQTYEKPSLVPGSESVLHKCSFPFSSNALFPSNIC